MCLSRDILRHRFYCHWILSFVVYDYTLALTYDNYLFGAYILAAGLIALFQGIISIGRTKTWILTVLLGVLEIGVGVYLLRHPGVSFAVLILLIAFSLIIYGVIEIVSSLSGDGSPQESKALAIITGALAILAGIVMFFQPASSGVAFVWVVGLFSLISGPMWIGLSLQLKNVDVAQPVKAV